MARFVLNETSYHGSGAIKEIVTEAKARGFKKALVCSDVDLIKFGVTAKVTTLLDEAGMEYAVFSDIKPNPTIENVQAGGAALNECGADYIIAVGGGSSMDCAKAVGARIVYPKRSLNQLKGLLKVLKKTPLLVAIPTTAGTGSEVTVTAVITDSEKKHKYTMNNFTFIPDYAVLDPEVTYTQPPS